MKKIFQTLVILCVFSVSTGALAACSTKINQGVTGGACSIKELQNLEKSKTVQGRFGVLQNSQRDLRPVATKPQTYYIENPNKIVCPMRGMCLYRELFEKN